MIIKTCPSCGHRETTGDEGWTNIGRTLVKCEKCTSIIKTGKVSYSSKNITGKVYYWIESYLAIVMFTVPPGVAIGFFSSNENLVAAIVGGIIGGVAGIIYFYPRVSNLIKISEMGLISNQEFNKLIGKR
jgi:hypothetical protein